MGQYWYVVNLDKKEFIHPHKLGCGLKLWEQLANHPSTGSALLILCAHPKGVGRGGGDFDIEKNWSGPERVFPRDNCQPGPMPEEYHKIARRTIGRWAGDRIMLIGDYSEKSDSKKYDLHEIYELCTDSVSEASECLKRKFKVSELYKDISEDVCAVIEHELHGRFTGTGWREWKENEEK
jgi:hypothetical protein